MRICLHGHGDLQELHIYIYIYSDLYCIGGSGRTSTSKCSDPGLSEKGLRQAHALGQRLSDFQEDAAAGRLVIMCSPMLRCLQTIEPDGVPRSEVKR